MAKINYDIKENVTWEMFEDVFLDNDCEVVKADKEAFQNAEISTEEYDEFIIQKLLEMKYIELAEVVE